MSWLSEANRIIKKCKSEDMYINFRSPLGWTPQDARELALNVQYFVFVDASYAALPDLSSIESVVVILGKVKSRDGDIMAVGNIIDFRSKKIRRVCKSSLAAESIALSNGCDLSMWLRMLTIEMCTGLFLREIVDAENGYSAVSPFGYAPGNQEIEMELQDLAMADETECSKKTLDEKALFGEQTLRERLFKFDKEQVGMCKLLIMTDSANAFFQFEFGPSSSLGEVASRDTGLCKKLAEPIIHQFY